MQTLTTLTCERIDANDQLSGINRDVWLDLLYVSGFQGKDTFNSRLTGNSEEGEIFQEAPGKLQTQANL